MKAILRGLETEGAVVGRVMPFVVGVGSIHIEMQLLPEKGFNFLGSKAVMYGIPYLVPVNRGTESGYPTCCVVVIFGELTDEVGVQNFSGNSLKWDGARIKAERPVLAIIKLRGHAVKVCRDMTSEGLSCSTESHFIKKLAIRSNVPIFGSFIGKQGFPSTTEGGVIEEGLISRVSNAFGGFQSCYGLDCDVIKGGGNFKGMASVMFGGEKQVYPGQTALLDT